MTERISINCKKEPGYDIVLADDFKELPSELKTIIPEHCKMCIVTDRKVAELYLKEVEETLKAAGNTVVSYQIPVGEEAKTTETVKALYEFLLTENFERKDILIALGGGVVGDLTGFAAATYMRGIRLVQIPTTLLAQTDSSIGGKTGVDFLGYKNMIGAFKMPVLVYSNLSVLKSLDDRQFFSGFAEVMKYGLIKDTMFYEWLIDHIYEICDKDTDTLRYMIQRSCEIKKYFVEKDPYENGERAFLNFGHTVGHAIEKSKKFSLLHGECVALGCIAAAFISWKKDLLSKEEYYEIRDMFVPFNLPISIEDIRPEEILDLTRKDKKAADGTVRFVLLKKIGKAVMDIPVSGQEILDAVNEIYFSEEDFYE